ncbi:unnamed protein product [Coregonus sp. 'balchen']|nr:unnamed protein product [Coregonus sp. 'balchen']
MAALNCNLNAVSINIASPHSVPLLQLSLSSCSSDILPLKHRQPEPTEDGEISFLLSLPFSEEDLSVSGHYRNTLLDQSFFGKVQPLSFR